jgi:hypothetical protein
MRTPFSSSWTARYASCLLLVCSNNQLLSQGTIAAWGYNEYGQIAVPSNLSGVVAIATGMGHSVALKNNGTVIAWGINPSGQNTVPSGLTEVKAIAAGYNLTVALKSDGTVAAWGNNQYGQVNIPSGLGGVKAVASGMFHIVALKSDGRVIAWGQNDLGQTNVPAGLSNVIAIAVGLQHSVALKSDGTAVAWGGNNWFGELDGFASLSGIKAVAAGGYHNVVLKNDGSLTAWGYNVFGQTNIPSGLSGVAAIAAGNYHTLALKDDGTVIAWGFNNYGQIGVPANLNGVTAIATKDSHNLVIKGYGAVRVNIVNPVDHTALGTSEALTLLANATGGDGAVTAVRFYDGSSLLGTRTNAPYSLVASNFPVGIHYLVASASNDLGAIEFSSPVAVTVTNSVPVPIALSSPMSISNRQFRVVLPPTGASNYLIQASEDLRSWINIGVTASSDTTEFVDADATNFGRRFYRLVENSFFTNNSFSGYVVKGPISHAQVWLYELNADGSQGTRLAGPLLTDANGQFTPPLVNSTTGFILAISTGGQYLNEVNGQLVVLQPGDQFTAVFAIPGPGAVVCVTPLTHIAAAKARADAGTGVALADAVNFANGSVAQQFGAPPIVSTVPNLATNAPLASRQYALLLAAISQLASELNVNPLVLINAWAQDALDGLMDGKNGANPLNLQTLTGQTISLPGMAEFNSALNNYIQNKGLGSAGAPVPPLEAIQLGMNTGGRVSALPTPLPAWVENRRGDVQLEARGGFPPYTWSYTPGGSAAPFWLTPQAPEPGGLTAGGNLFGTPPLLASGSTMSISAPFSVRVTDSGGNFVDMQLRATIVPAPPAITNLVLPPAVAGVPYIFQLSGTGGRPPYTFAFDATEGGFQPFWLHLGLDGILSGTPPLTAAGNVFTFGVSIVDSARQKGDPPVVLNVISPPPSVSIQDASVTEGNQGSVNASFLVSLDRPSAVDVIVTYSTANGSATAGQDYVAVGPAQLTIPAGALSRFIPVKVTGDTNVEPNETFLVTLANPTNATLGRAQAIGTIINDDVLPPFIITSTSLPSALNQGLQPPYLASVLASGGVPPCVWNASGLPQGFNLVTLQSDGKVICDEVDISGSPGNGQPLAGDYSVTITGTDSLGRTAQKTLNLNISAPVSSYTLTVTKTGNGTGNVALSPPGGTYTNGTVVTLTATPNSGSSFAGWSGDGTGSGTRMVTMNGNKSVTATFNTNPTDTISGNWAGIWSGSGFSGTWTATFVNNAGTLSGTWQSSDGSAGTISGSPTSLTFGGSGSGVTFTGSISGSSISGTFSDPEFEISGPFSGSKQ